MNHLYAPFLLLPFLPAIVRAQGDDCASALAVVPGAYSADGPSAGGGAGQDGALNADWYQWTASEQVYITVQSCGSGVDTRLHVYTGTCGELELVASDDDGCPEGASGGSLVANLLVDAGATYYFEWDDAHSTAGFDWSFQPHACPSIVPVVTTTLGGVSLDWTVVSPGAGYLIEYGPSGFTPGSGTTSTGTQGDTQPPVIISGLSEGQVYDFYISSGCGGGDPSPVTGPWAAIAGGNTYPNDDCGNDQPITCGTITNGSTLLAVEDGTPECVTSVSAPGVWYGISDLGGTVVLSTCDGSNYDTKIVVYTGPCDDLVCVTGNDDGPFDCEFGSNVVLNAEAGTAYHVLVQGYNGAVGDFALAMNCSDCSLPTNVSVVAADDFAVMNWITANADGTFSLEFGPDGFAPGTGTVISGTVGVDGPPVTIAGLTLSTDYDLYLTEDCPGGAGIRRGPWSFTTLDTAPEDNAFCETASGLTCGSTAEGNTAMGVLATLPYCGSAYVTAPGLWYTFTGDGNDVTLSTCNDAEFDTRISVFSGDCPAPVCVAGNDDAPGCGGNTSSVTIHTENGASYLAYVHGYNGATGAFTISMNCAAPCSPAVSGDDCTTAITLVPQPLSDCVPTTGTNVCAYEGPLPNPDCDPYSAAHDVWYAINTGPSSDHTITVATVTASPVLVALYGSCDEAGYIACHDPSEGAIVLTGLDQSATYYLRVWNEGGPDAGTFTICDEAPIVTRIDEPGSDAPLRVWPVPVDDVLALDGVPTGSERLVVRDTQGRQVGSKRVDRTGTMTLDLGMLAPGAYTVHVIGPQPQVVHVVVR